MLKSMLVKKHVQTWLLIGWQFAYVRNDLPHRRVDDLEIVVNLPIEALVIDIMVRKEAWLFICLYSPHNKHKHICCHTIDVLLEKTRCSAQLTFVIGDLNINGLCENYFRCLQDVMDVYDMFNIVDKPTCFKTENNMLYLMLYLLQTRRESLAPLMLIRVLVIFTTLLPSVPKCMFLKRVTEIDNIAVISILTMSFLKMISPRHPIMSVTYLTTLMIHIGLIIRW